MKRRVEITAKDIKRFQFPKEYENEWFTFVIDMRTKAQLLQKEGLEISGEIVVKLIESLKHYGFLEFTSDVTNKKLYVGGGIPPIRDVVENIANMFLHVEGYNYYQLTREIVDVMRYLIRCGAIAYEEEFDEMQGVVGEVPEFIAKMILGINPEDSIDTPLKQYAVHLDNGKVSYVSARSVESAIFHAKAAEAKCGRVANVVSVKPVVSVDKID